MEKGLDMRLRSLPGLWLAASPWVPSLISQATTQVPSLSHTHETVKSSVTSPSQVFLFTACQSKGLTVPPTNAIGNYLLWRAMKDATRMQNSGFLETHHLVTCFLIHTL